MGKGLALWVVPAWVLLQLHWSQVLLGPSHSSPLSLLSSESLRVTVSFFSGLWQSASSIRPCACSLHSSVISIISMENPIKSSISVVLWSLFFINHASLSFVPLSGPMLVFEGPSGGLPRGGSHGTKNQLSILSFNLLIAQHLSHSLNYGKAIPR